MKPVHLLAIAIILVNFQGCASVSKSSRLELPVEKGKLIPKEAALEYVKSHLSDVDNNGILLFSEEGSSIDKAMIKISYKGEKKRHYGYYGITVEVREYKWPPQKGKNFALLLTGTAGPGTLPGRRILWFEEKNLAKDVATALIALGAKPAE